MKILKQKTKNFDKERKKKYSTEAGSLRKMIMT